MSESKPNNTGEAQNSPSSGLVLKLIFFTLFIDLIGFSIIFPLFPGMLDYYHATEGDSGLFGLMYAGLAGFSSWGGNDGGEWRIIVLFGGVLAALYSLLQFVFAPFFGMLSDRVGRKPVLVFCLSGILLSYALWFFAGGFLLLVIARFIGGMMSANISTATAVVADVTAQKERSRGMAIIGIAFGLGFIIGPAIGGISATWDLTAQWPGLAAYGVNPYSMPAAVAFLLTLANVFLVCFKLPETRALAGEDGVHVRRTVNPAALFQKEAYPGVSRTNLANFLFIFAFAGMEFSLTFLAVDRLGFSHMQNAYMFIFVGVVMALVQGGYVRRKADKIGPKKMTMQGFLVMIPALALVGAAGQWQSVGLLYLGLFLLALGSALATPCLASLVSLYSPAEEQGRISGGVRSMGALGRAGGRLVGCVVYWRLGAATAYYLGALSIILPLLIAGTLPKPGSDAPAA